DRGIAVAVGVADVAHGLVRHADAAADGRGITDAARAGLAFGLVHTLVTDGGGADEHVRARVHLHRVHDRRGAVRVAALGLHLRDARVRLRSVDAEPTFGSGEAVEVQLGLERELAVRRAVTARAELAAFERGDL